MRVDGNHGSTLGYEPNSYGEWQQQPEFAEPPLALEGAADHWDFRADDDDYFTQPGLLFRLMSADAAAGAVREHRPGAWATRRRRSRSATSATA